MRRRGVRRCEATPLPPGSLPLGFRGDPFFMGDLTGPVGSWLTSRLPCPVRQGSWQVEESVCVGVG